jgi:mannose-6-phosphate isomerase-like protein (cupin superfamily)
MAEILPLREADEGEMQGRIAYFKDLIGFDKGFSDDGLPGSKRTLFNVMGFQDKPSDPSLNSPVGQDAAATAAIKVSDGFNLGYIKCKPGNGPLMHNHDTNETFIPITGKWELSWDDENTKSAILGPLDCCAFPPGVARTFKNITEGEDDVEHLMIVIVAGNTPVAGLTEKARERLAQLRAEEAEATT